MTWYALPQKSAVDMPYRFDEAKNTVPGNRNTAEHVDYIFNHVVQELVDEKAKMEVIGVSEGAVRVSLFLDNEENFKKWGGRIDAFASLAPYFLANDIKTKAFGDWLRDVSLPLIPKTIVLANIDPAWACICGIPRAMWNLPCWA